MYYYILGFIFLSTTLFSQVNLVPNYSFEELDSCPSQNSQIYLASPWFQPVKIAGSTTLGSSSDLFNSCSINNTISTPTNFAGTEFPKTGVCYAGIFGGGIPPIPNSGREYLEVRLIEPLVKDKKYCVDFFVSLSDNSNYATSNIGVYFSKDSLIDDTSGWLHFNINVIPQIVNDFENILVNKNGWDRINKYFISVGGEKYLTIGNFDIDLNVNLFYVGDGDNDFAYYYIDDVSVVLCEDTLPVPSDTFYLHIPNVFTPNADGKNDTWQVKANRVQQLHAAVYNRWGSLLWQQEVQATDTTNQTLTLSWDGRSNTGMPASAGTYYYLVTCTTKEGEVKKEKGFLTLVR